MPASISARDVFINCPFDSIYKPIFWAIVFTVLRSGFSPRCAPEADDPSENRLTKIQGIIEECRYGIHDISMDRRRWRPTSVRSNVPWSLASFWEPSAMETGTRDQRKQALILDREQYRY